MTEKEYKEFYDRYKLLSPEKLKEITVENGWQADAEKVAKDILNGDRKEYFDYIQENIEKNNREHHMQELKNNNPLYGDIHQIANDVRFFKNVFLVCLVINVIFILIYLYSLMF